MDVKGTIGNLKAEAEAKVSEAVDFGQAYAGAQLNRVVAERDRLLNSKRFWMEVAAVGWLGAVVFALAAVLK